MVWWVMVVAGTVVGLAVIGLWVLAALAGPPSDMER